MERIEANVAQSACVPPAAAPVCTASRGEAAQAALVAAAAHGSIQAFETLYRIYHPRLARFLERLIHRPQLAEEMLNDTMLTVWHKARTYNGHSKVSTWIFAIAYRKALKARKRLDDPVGAVPYAEETSVTPEGELLQLELSARISTAVRTLSAEQRAVIQLNYFHGFDYPEIAAIVDCPLGTVKTRMLHARRKLERLLAGEREYIR
jgi:RNA polymerase sigma-70 factor (ECF subfamily)